MPTRRPGHQLERPNICDHLVLHVDEYGPRGVWVSGPIRRTRGKMFDNEDASVVSFHCCGPGIFVVALEESVTEVAVDAGRTTTT
jgi:hypothetical protein